MSPSPRRGQASGKPSMPVVRTAKQPTGKTPPAKAITAKRPAPKGDAKKIAPAKSVAKTPVTGKPATKPTPARASAAQPRNTDIKVKTVTAVPMKPHPKPTKQAATAKPATKPASPKSAAVKPVAAKPLGAKLATPKPTLFKPPATRSPAARVVAAKPAAPARASPPPPPRAMPTPQSALAAARPNLVPPAPRAQQAVSQEIRKPIIPERPVRVPSKQETFVAGDYVVYPTHGVGKVERIAVEDIAGHRLELIHITFEENRMTLRVPVTKARTAGLRKLASRKMFDDAMAVLKGRARIKRTMWSRRAQEYEAKINSGDPQTIAEVVRDLHRNVGQPDQSFSERQIYEAAMDRLAAELAALDKTDKATAAIKLAEFLKAI